MRVAIRPRSLGNDVPIFVVFKSVGAVVTAFLYWDWFMNPIVAFGMKKLLDHKCSRENEFEADRDAVTFCHRAGYSAHAGAEFLERLDT